jgi:hypothetical protein
MLFKKPFPHEIKIIPTVNGGVIVLIGCATLSYSNPAKMLSAMREYIKDPEGIEKNYCKSQGNLRQSDACVYGLGLTRDADPDADRVGECSSEAKTPGAAFQEGENTP